MEKAEKISHGKAAFRNVQKFDPSINNSNRQDTEPFLATRKKKESEINSERQKPVPPLLTSPAKEDQQRISCRTSPKEEFEDLCQDQQRLDSLQELPASSR